MDAKLNRSFWGTGVEAPSCWHYAWNPSKGHSSAELIISSSTQWALKAPGQTFLQPHPLSHPAAEVLQQVQLYGLDTAVVAACVDLKHITVLHIQPETSKKTNTTSLWASPCFCAQPYTSPCPCVRRTPAAAHVTAKGNNMWSAPKHTHTHVLCVLLHPPADHRPALACPSRPSPSPSPAQSPR